MTRNFRSAPLAGVKAARSNPAPDHLGFVTDDSVVGRSCWLPKMFSQTDWRLDQGTQDLNRESQA